MWQEIKSSLDFERTSTPNTNTKLKPKTTKGDKSKDLHFNITLRSATFIDIETKHVTPQNISSSHGDQLECNEETHQAKPRVDEDRTLELAIDIVVETE